MVALHGRHVLAEQSVALNVTQAQVRWRVILACNSVQEYVSGQVMEDCMGGPNKRCH